MRIPCSLLLCLFVLALPAAGAEGKKPATNAEKIVGTWKTTKSTEAAAVTMEFTKDGKLKVIIKVRDKTLTVDRAYKVEGDKLICTVQGADGKKTTFSAGISKLTDKALVIEHEKVTEEYRRAK